MARNKLESIATGDVFTRTRVDSIRQALIRELLGRGTTGAPAPEQGLGTPTYRWNEIHAQSIVVNGSELDANLFLQTDNAIISGATRTGSGQAAYLRPAGSGGGASCSVLAASTQLVYRVNGVRSVASANLALSSLTLAPSSNNTATVNDATISNESQASRVFGEDYWEKNYLTITSAGTEITNRIGQTQAFLLSNASTGESEYLLAYIESATKLSRIRRGYFYDEDAVPIERIRMRNGNTLTVLSTAWIFLEDDGTTLDASFRTPVYSATEPGSPSTDDYWYDLTENVWKRYNGSAFVQIDRTLIGVVAVNTADAVAARSTQFFATYDRLGSIELKYISGSVIRASIPFTEASIEGVKGSLNFTHVTFGTGDIAAAADTYHTTLSGSAWWWYLYLTEDFEPKISNFEPYWYKDRKGWYHPHQTWRAIGRFLPSGTSFSSSVESLTDSPLRRLPYFSQRNEPDSSNYQETATINVYVPLSMSVAVNHLQPIVTWSSNTVFQFIKAGLYSVGLTLGMFGPIVGGAKIVFTIDVRLYNNTLAVSAGRIGSFEITRDSATTEYKTLSFKRHFQILDTSNDYSIELAVTVGAGTAVTRVFYKYVDFEWLGKR